MAKRDQPYFPLYVQDYLTDEKLNMCSWKTQGIYIKILCVLHKQKEYGKILFKLNPKQTLGRCLDFASILVKNLPCQLDEMTEALEELVEHEVLTIEDGILLQKRMVQDNKTSEARSLAGKKGGGNPILLKQKSKPTFKQKHKQNTEYVYEYENEVVIDNNKGVEEKNEIIDHPYISKIKADYPKLLKMDMPLTNDEADKLQMDLGDEAVYKLLQAMANWKQLLKKNSSANLTIRNWHKNGNTTNATDKVERVGRMAKSDLEEFMSRPTLNIKIGGLGS